MRKIATNNLGFIIVGTMKSGTSSLRQHLRNHEKIHLTPKELQFFSRKHNYSKGLDWYLGEILKGNDKNAKIIGEKTPEYAYNPYSAKRIAESFPHVKLLWIFRNPVDRSYSNYMHNRTYGDELFSFEKAIVKEKNNKRNEYLHYLKRSTYHEQVARFLEYFPLERMHFVFFEDIIKPYNEDHAINGIFEFLGVTPEGFVFDEEPRNKTVLPRFPILFYLAKKWGLTKSYKVNRLIRYLNFKNKKAGYPKMNEKTRSELSEYFKPHNEKLSQLIGKDVSFWDYK